MNTYIYENKEEKEKIINVKSERSKELELYEEKTSFVQQLTSEKKEYSKKIKNIDRIINNKDVLKEEYTKRNEKLANKDKIFSISHLVDALEKEREELLKKIKRNNKLLEPKEFLKQKQTIEEEVNFLNQEKSIIDCVKACLECAKVEIQKLEEKTDIVKWMYKIRYYSQLPFSQEKNLRDLKELEEDFKEVIKIIIRKAVDNKVFDKFSENDEILYTVINELFESRIISFENINMVCKYDNKVLTVKYYDGETLEDSAKFKMENVKIKKKIKLFI